MRLMFSYNKLTSNNEPNYLLRESYEYGSYWPLFYYVQPWPLEMIIISINRLLNNQKWWSQSNFSL
jgi:hypothetical protein